MSNQLWEIPDSFWSLFRSGNRKIYIEALLQINEEYQYSNYFLSKEVCIQTLSDYFAKQKVTMEQEELEDDFDMLEPLAARILNWLLRTRWLRKVEDYSTLTTNIVIPDYAAVFIEAFIRLSSDEEDEAQVYIQNIYAILFAFKNDPRSNISLLKAALVNTRRLNKSLQDMLHNMDKFFSSLLEKQFYGDLLKEHLEGYVEEIVRKKYHMLKTSDNFYLYKTDIKAWLKEMRYNLPWLEQVCQKNKKLRGVEIGTEELARQLDLIERGFDDMEHRIMNMDKEHTKYIRATVMRLNYLLNQEDNMKGLIIGLLNHLSEEEGNHREQDLTKIGNLMNLSQFTVISEKSLYKRRRSKQDFTESLQAQEEYEELSKEAVLNWNKTNNRYSRRQIEEFVLERMEKGRFEVDQETVTSEEEFEKLVLAYDYSTRKTSPYQISEQGIKMIDNGSFCYPNLVFERRQGGAGKERHMIDYFEQLSAEEQQKVKESIQLLYRQTFLLERKYDRRSGRYQMNQEFYKCNKYLEFIRIYFSIMDIEVLENSQMGVIYLRGEQVVGEKLPKLATLYILILKLIYDEQMSAVSTSMNAMTTLTEIHEKLGMYHLLKKQPSVTEIRRSLALLKRYQIVEPLDVLEELDGFSRMVIYPAIQVVLLGDDARELLQTFREGDAEDDESEI